MFLKFIKDSATDPFFYIALAVIGLFLYAFVSVFINDQKKNKIKENGSDAVASIVSLRSKSGENSAYINVGFKVSYLDESGK